MLPHDHDFENQALFCGSFGGISGMRPAAAAVSYRYFHFLSPLAVSRPRWCGLTPGGVQVAVWELTERPPIRSRLGNHRSRLGNQAQRTCLRPTHPGTGQRWKTFPCPGSYPHSWRIAYVKRSRHFYRADPGSSGSKRQIPTGGFRLRSDPRKFA